MQKNKLEKCVYGKALSKDVFVVYLLHHHLTWTTSLYLPQWKSDQWMYCRLPVSKNTLPLNSWSVGSCVLVANTSSVSWLTLVYCLNFRMLTQKIIAFSIQMGFQRASLWHFCEFIKDISTGHGYEWILCQTVTGALLHGDKPAKMQLQKNSCKK